ncbi:YcgL domain-containing protein [Desulfonema magnum]|uniref:YcgL-like domain-containing protein n=1 Tax=Desulfonema magnum TaxID=45655 RepID=A0A975BIV8_9BACT|nr:YcgL domain-containing protein [Desulfonema magnum]QTA86177.1 YcgL-like domain-containing protein [Desulfonema magnum]
MKVDIYKARKIPSPTERMYVFIPSDKSPDFLPDEVMRAAGALDFEKKISIRPGEKKIALNTDEAVRDIREKGFHIVCT